MLRVSIDSELASCSPDHLNDMNAALVACHYRNTQDRQAITEHLMQWRARLQGRQEFVQAAPPLPVDNRRSSNRALWR